MAEDQQDRPFEPSLWAGFFAMLTTFRESLSALDDQVLAYRNDLEKAGWSPAIAESMADRFHEVIMTQMINQPPPPPPKEDT